MSRRIVEVPLPLLAACVASLTSACALLGGLRFERPTAELEAIQITGLGLSGGSLNLLLDVYNPNDYDIRTSRIEAAIELEETHFGNVMLERDILLPGTEHTVVGIPVTFTWSGLGAGARGLLQRGAVNYRLDSKIRVDTPVGTRTVSLTNRGLVPLTELF